MAAWKSDVLTRIGGAEEVEIEVLGRDGKMRRPVTIWLVRVDDDLYVRSVRGRSGAWFRAVQQTHQGRLSGAGLEKDARFEEGEASINDQVDATYRAKYRRYAGRILDSCLTPEARSTTMRVVPR
jgi:hypothetical protein